jgi:hypothetical protein
MTGRESQAGRPKKQAVYLGSARIDAPAHLRARVPAPSRAVATVKPEDRQFYKQMSICRNEALHQADNLLVRIAYFSFTSVDAHASVRHPTQLKANNET